MTINVEGVLAAVTMNPQPVEQYNKLPNLDFDTQNVRLYVQIVNKKKRMCSYRWITKSMLQDWI